MKFQLGFSILLALVVGLICVCPVKSLYLEEETKDDVAPPSAQSESNSSAISDPAFGLEGGDSHEQTKRNDIGMPISSHTGTNPETEPVTSTAQDKPSQENVMSKSANEPLNASTPTQNGDSADRVGSAISPSSSDPANAKIESSPRGLGHFVSSFSSLSGQSGSSPPQDSLDQSQSSGENLPAPVIIENDRRLDSPQANLETQQQQQQQQKQQQSQQIQQQPEQNKQVVQQVAQARMGPTSSSEIELPSISPGNSSLPASTARTFESWTNCVGASSNKYGTCKNDVECKKHKGQDDGSCMGGLGVCCVMALTCGDKSLENNTFFANPDFPDASWEARLCEVEIKKKHKKILQIMIEFEEFELAPPNHDGECHTDVFQVKLASNRPSPYSLLRMCGQNTGQHMYLDVSQVDEGIVLSVATSGGGFPRRWSIRIVQMDEKNFLLAPPGCLQYYTDTVGHFRSFNLGKNLRNLYYAICFRIDNGYSGIRFTSNFFGMHGPHCRRKPQISGGRYNASYDAHPHHLVIPPPGYAPPPPKPRYPSQAHYPLPPAPQQQQQQQQPPQPYGPITQGPQAVSTYQPQTPRYKRYAYIESTDSVEISERYPRTFHEGKEHKFEEKEVKLEHPQLHGPYYPHPLPPPSYGPTYGPGYGPPVAGYGPPPPSYYGQQSEYYPPPRHYYEHGKTEFKEDKFSHKFEEKEGKKGFWKDKHESKFGPSYGPPMHNYGYGHQAHHGPPQFGSYGGYGGGYSYGEYHHKEIDKFGKKYEHLEYKHEKNHLKKEEKEEKKESKWWPSWGKKEEKKDKKDKDKFTQHHEALFPMMHIPEMPHCEPRFCGANDVITFPPSGDSIAEMCGNRFNRGRGPKIISGSPLVVYVSNRGQNRGAGFDMNYEQIFFIPKPY